MANSSKFDSTDVSGESESASALSPLPSPCVTTLALTLWISSFVAAIEFFRSVIVGAEGER